MILSAIPSYIRARIKNVAVNLFYVSSLDDDPITLEGEEFRHCVQSFRQQEGDTILLTDGQGTKAQARIDHIQKKSLTATIVNRESPGSGRTYHLEVAIAPTKNINRIEWFVEKSVELGIDAISFITTTHSERRKIRLDRLERIAVAAMKQSQQYSLPELHALQPLEAYLENKPVTGDQRAWLAHFHPEAPNLTAEHNKNGHYRVLIGPEGDFSEDELSDIRSAGWKICTLGDRRLRTETAGLSAVAYFHWLHV